MLTPSGSNKASSDAPRRPCICSANTARQGALVRREPISKVLRPSEPNSPRSYATKFFAFLILLEFQIKSPDIFTFGSGLKDDYILAVKVLIHLLALEECV